MKVFMIGGTGFLGWHTLRELVARGHEVSTLALPPLPAPGIMPEGAEVRLGNAFTMGDTELLGLLEGCEGFMYAAGLDDRVILPKPAYPKFREANVDQCLRLLGLAREARRGLRLLLHLFRPRVAGAPPRRTTLLHPQPQGAA